MTHPPNLLPNMVGKDTVTLPKDLRVKNAVVLWKAAPAFVPDNHAKCTINTKEDSKVDIRPSQLPALSTKYYGKQTKKLLLHPTLKQNLPMIESLDLHFILKSKMKIKI